jgi:tetratricopeptide (TPR) repeat protein
MRPLLYRIALSTIAMFVLVFRWPTVDAQPAPGAPAPVSATQLERARKLTEEALAAESNKEYVTAIALYQRAYQIVPHPLLQFNIGQAYMLAQDFVQAEIYYRLYLTRDPNGPGAARAREFLASRSTTSPDLSERRSTTEGGHPPGQIEPISAASDKNGPRQAPDVETPVASPRISDAEARYKRARHIQRTGYKLLGGGLGLGVVAFGLAFYRADVGRGLGIAALLTTSTGIGVAWYANNQIRAAKSIAWSPVLGPGFTGVAFTGTFPHSHRPDKRRHPSPSSAPPLPKPLGGSIPSCFGC